MTFILKRCGGGVGRAPAPCLDGNLWSSERLCRKKLEPCDVSPNVGYHAVSSLPQPGIHLHSVGWAAWLVGPAWLCPYFQIWQMQKLIPLLSLMELGYHTTRCKLREQPSKSRWREQCMLTTLLARTICNVLSACIYRVYNRIIALWSRVFPSIVHLDVFVCLTLITQNHLRGLYLGKHSTSVQ